MGSKNATEVLLKLMKAADVIEPEISINKVDFKRIGEREMQQKKSMSD